MLSKVYDVEMKRGAEASCLKCEKLHTSCYLKKYILSKEIEVCDYARWGCIKYKGEGQRKQRGKAIDRVREYLLEQKQFTASEIAEALCIDRQVVINTINRLEKQGLQITKKYKNNELTYENTTLSSL